MKKLNFINETLNQILLEVFSGVDYVSKIALETQKSIPVVFRQLDVLVDFGLLNKQRVGKKVSYAIDWINLGDFITTTLLLDIKKLRELTGAKKKESQLIKEMSKLLNLIPLKIIDDKKILNKEINSFFSEEKVKEIFKKYVLNLNKSTKETSYKKRDFNQNMILFFDMFGMMKEEKLKKLLSKKVYDKHKDFLNYCKLRHFHEKSLDPRFEFLN